MAEIQQLTARQQEIYDFIASRIRDCGYAPTIREIGAHLGIRSTNGVADHLKALKRKGYLSQAANRSRTWQPLRPGRTAAVPRRGAEAPAAPGVRVPILGRVAAGEPILAEEQAEGSLTVDAALLPRGRRVFALHIVGDSMINAGIHDGDIVFVDRRPDADPGHIVVALIDDEATVKYYRPEADLVRLQPANDAMPDIVVHRRAARSLRLMGVVVGVYHRL